MPIHAATFSRTELLKPSNLSIRPELGPNYFFTPRLSVLFDEWIYATAVLVDIELPRDHISGQLGTGWMADLRIMIYAGDDPDYGMLIRDAELIGIIAVGTCVDPTHILLQFRSEDTEPRLLLPLSA